MKITKTASVFVCYPTFFEKYISLFRVYAFSSLTSPNPQLPLYTVKKRIVFQLFINVNLMMDITQPLSSGRRDIKPSKQLIYQNSVRRRETKLPRIPKLFTSFRLIALGISTYRFMLLAVHLEN